VRGRPSLLEAVRGLLERTYRLRTASLDLASFVIGDEGYRRIYAARPEVKRVGTRGGEARTLVREGPGGLRARVYYPDELIRALERHPPQRGVHEANVDGFATLVEELDHLLCIADRAVLGRPLSLFELELHANVSKYLVLARFLAGAGRPLSSSTRAWLRFHLFDKVRYRDEDAGVEARYRDAARWAVRLIDAIGRMPPRSRVEALRAFHDAGPNGKVGLIERLAAV